MVAAYGEMIAFEGRVQLLAERCSSSGRRSQATMQPRYSFSVTAARIFVMIDVG